MLVLSVTTLRMSCLRNFNVLLAAVVALALLRPALWTSSNLMYRRRKKVDRSDGRHLRYHRIILRPHGMHSQDHHASVLQRQYGR